jgi:hypothetical protein
VFAVALPESDTVACARRTGLVAQGQLARLPSGAFELAIASSLSDPDLPAVGMATDVALAEAT